MENSQNPKTENQEKQKTENPPEQKNKFYERFDAYSRFLHILVITSFISLAITGMTIKFSGIGLFQTISKMMGGYAVTGFIHRFAAVITFIYFGLHIGYLIKKVRKRKIKVTSFLKGQNSLIPNKNGLLERDRDQITEDGLTGKSLTIGQCFGAWRLSEAADYCCGFPSFLPASVSRVLL